MITTDQILQKTNTYDIIEYYTRDVRKGIRLEPMKLFQSPLEGTQKTPSFNISYWQGKYYWKDYSGGSGSCFDLVMQMYGLDLPKACAKINEDMDLGIDGGGHVEAERQYKPEPKILPTEKNTNYRIHKRTWQSKIDDSFWGQYGIKEKDLLFYNCFPISKFNAYNRYNKPYEIKARYNDPLYFYQGNGGGEIYRPCAKYTSKFYNIGVSQYGILWGYNQLPQSGKRVFFVGGKKDVITMRVHGYFAVTFDSEEANPARYPEFLKLITSSRFEEYIFMYDRDETGVNRMLNNALKFNCGYMIPPDMGEEGTDISDWFKLYYSRLTEKT